MANTCAVSDHKKQSILPKTFLLWGKGGLKIIQLEIKRCLISNLRTGEILPVQFNQEADYHDFFADQEELDLLLELEIGIQGAKPADIFSVRVASVAAVQRYHLHLKSSEKKGRHMVFPHCTWALLKEKLVDILRLCSDYTYMDSVEKLLQYFYWEYEDM